MPPPKDNNKPRKGETVEIWDYVQKQFDTAAPRKITQVLDQDLHGNYMVELTTGLLISVEPSRYTSSHQPYWREVRARG